MRPNNEKISSADILAAGSGSASDRMISERFRFLANTSSIRSSMVPTVRNFVTVTAPAAPIPVSYTHL
ncbi:MAG: hypothetical protein MPJ25_02600, partial [Pirellulales bacterium]|nr:hypothetical protein [Pirellulales bacterium]